MVSLNMAKLICVEPFDVGWRQDKHIFLSRLKVAKAFAANGVEFIKRLGIGVQSAAYLVKVNGTEMCLKLSVIDHNERWRVWDDAWGTRPWDLPILAQANFFFTYDELKKGRFGRKSTIQHKTIHIKAVFQEAGRQATEQEGLEAERYWNWMGVYIQDSGSRQWVTLADGKTYLTDYSCIERNWTWKDVAKVITTRNTYRPYGRSRQAVAPRTHRSQFCHCRMCRTTMLNGRRHPDTSEF